MSLVVPVSVSAGLSRTTRLPNPTFFTISMWCMLDSITNSSTVYPFRINDSGTHQLNGYLSNNGTNARVGYQDDLVGLFDNVETTIKAFVPFHFAFSVRASNVVGASNLFLNGRNTVSQRNFTFTPVSFVLANTGGSGAQVTIADVRIWDRALTQGEIQQDMQSDVPVSYANLNSWYKCESAAQSVVDTSGNNLIMTPGAGLTSRGRMQSNFHRSTIPTLRGGTSAPPVFVPYQPAYMNAPMMAQ